MRHGLRCIADCCCGKNARTAPASRSGCCTTGWRGEVALAALKKLGRRMPEPADIKALFREIRLERNDRGAAMLVCGFLDQYLKTAILRAAQPRRRDEAVRGSRCAA